MTVVLSEWRRSPLRRALDLVLYPCVLLMKPSIAAYKSIQENLHHRRQWPKPLPRRQQRREVKVATTVEHFSNAGHFARLPYELRLRIYEYVLGGRQINIVHCPGKRRLAHRCQLYDASDPNVNERDARNQCSEEHWTDPPCNLSLLLRTCRLIYTEAAEVLYTKNSFGVYGLQNLASFVCFSRTIRPQRLASIAKFTVIIQNWHRITAQEKEILRYLFVIYGTIPGFSNHRPRFTYPYSKLRDPDRAYPWRQLWRIVKEEMTGLRVLNVRLVDLTHEAISLTPHITADWILPILEIPGVEVPPDAEKPGVEKFTLRKLPAKTDRKQTMPETDMVIVGWSDSREL